MMDMGCAEYYMDYVIKVYERVSMHYIFNHIWIVEVLLISITWPWYGNGSGVVITDAGVLYTVNGIANANEHGPFQTAMTATKN